MKDFFVPLERRGFVRGNSLIRRRIDHADPESILEAVAEVAAHSEDVSPPSTTEFPFTHAATLSLSGAPTPCAHVDCRVDHARQVAQYAALYSDRVYIYNVFSDLLTRGYAQGAGDADTFRKRFADATSVLLTLRPLIEHERVVPVNPPANHCNYHSAYHFADEVFGDDSFDSLRAREDELRNEFLSEVNVKIEPAPTGSGWLALSDGPERLLAHAGSVREYERFPDELEEYDEVRAQLKSGHRVQLSEAQVRDLGLHDEYAKGLVSSLGLEMYCAETLGSSFLTERPLHIDLLNRLSGRTSLEERNQIALQHLSSMVPFVEELSPSELLHIRENEQAAFAQYRRALNEAVDEFRQGSDDFTERDAKALYREVIHPELEDIRQSISSARDTLLRGSVRTATSAAATIGFGLYFGLLSDPLQGVGLLGASEAVKRLMEAGDSEERAEDHQLYFLWEVRKRTIND